MIDGSKVIIYSKYIRKERINGIYTKKLAKSVPPARNVHPYFGSKLLFQRCVRIFAARCYMRDHWLK